MDPRLPIYNIDEEEREVSFGLRPPTGKFILRSATHEEGFPVGYFAKWFAREAHCSALKKVIPGLKKVDLKVLLVKECERNHLTPLQISKLAASYNLSLTLIEMRDMLISAGWFVPKSGSFNKIYVERLIKGQKRLFDSTEVLTCEAPRCLTKNHIAQLIRAYEDDQIRAYFPDTTSYETTDRAYILQGLDIPLCEFVVQRYGEEKDRRNNNQVGVRESDSEIIARIMVEVMPAPVGQGGQAGQNVEPINEADIEQ